MCGFKHYIKVVSNVLLRKFLFEQFPFDPVRWFISSWAEANDHYSHHHRIGADDGRCDAASPWRILSLWTFSLSWVAPSDSPFQAKTNLWTKFFMGIIKISHTETSDSLLVAPQQSFFCAKRQWELSRETFSLIPLIRQKQSSRMVDDFFDIPIGNANFLSNIVNCSSGQDKPLWTIFRNHASNFVVSPCGEIYTVAWHNIRAWYFSIKRK